MTSQHGAALVRKQVPTAVPLSPAETREPQVKYAEGERDGEKGGWESQRRSGYVVFAGGWQLRAGEVRYNFHSPPLGGGIWAGTALALALSSSCLCLLSLGPSRASARPVPQASSRSFSSGLVVSSVKLCVRGGHVSQVSVPLSASVPQDTHAKVEQSGSWPTNLPAHSRHHCLPPSWSARYHSPNCPVFMWIGLESLS